MATFMFDWMKNTARLLLFAIVLAVVTLAVVGLAAVLYMDGEIALAGGIVVLYLFVGCGYIITKYR